MARPKSLKTIGIALIALQTEFPARAQSLPPEVQAEIHEAAEACKPDKTALPKDFITRKDINGDGVADFIVDYSEVRCKDDTRPFCGTRGCSVTVFASLSNGTYAKVDVTVHRYSFRRIKGRSAMILYSACKKGPGDLCTSVLYWNDSTFTPSH